MIRRLLIVDHYDSTAFDHLARTAAPGDACDVLLLGLSTEWQAWQHAAVLPPGRAWTVVDPGAFAVAACRRVAAFVSDVVAGLPDRDLGGTTLAALLRRAGRTDWWFAETSERGPYRGPLIGQLYRLALTESVYDAGRYDEVWFSVAEADLAATLRTAAWPTPRVESAPRATPSSPILERWPLVRSWVQAVRAGVQLAASAVVSRFARPPLTAGVETTFTLFPVWWFGAFSAAPRERFFAPRVSPDGHRYLAWLTGGPSLWSRRHAIRKACHEQGILPLQQFLGVGDAIAIFSPLAFLQQVTFEWRLRRRLSAPFGRYDAGPLLGRDVSRSLASAELVRDRLIERAVARAVKRIRPRRVFYRAEYQPIEHALLRGLEDGGHPPRLGFVHFPFGGLYLPTRLTPAERTGFGRGTAGTDTRPMPDGLVAIGPAARRHAIAGGAPGGRVAVCGPQRYGQLQRVLRVSVTRPDARASFGVPRDTPMVLVALAILDADTEALCAALANAASAFRDALVVIRPHPNQPQGKGPVAALVEHLGPGRAQLMPVERDIYDALRAADVLVCIGSMVAFEAMALGVMPIVFENPSTFPATSLREFDAGLFVVADAVELAAAMTAVWQDSLVARAKRDAWSRVLQDVFADLQRPLEAQMDEALQTLAAESTTERSDTIAREEPTP